MQQLIRLGVLSVVIAGCAVHQQPLVPSGVGHSAEVAIFQNSNAAYEARPEDVLMHAIGLVGTPYRWGGNTPESGFDCSGLIRYVFDRSASVYLPRTTEQMWAQGGSSVSRRNLRSGDVVFFATSGGKRVSHAGIYVGDGRFVHAPSSGGTVRLDDLEAAYWQKTYLTAKRFIP